MRVHRGGVAPSSVEEEEGAPWKEGDSWLEDYLQSNPHNNLLAPLLEAVPRQGPA